MKKLSTARLEKKLQQQKQQQQAAQEQRLYQLQLELEQRTNWALQMRLYEQLSLASAKSADSYLTYLPEAAAYYSEAGSVCCCCHCDEQEENQRNEDLETENQRNENRENEMCVAALGQ